MLRATRGTDAAPALLLVDAERHEPALPDAVPVLSTATQAVPAGPTGPEHLWAEHDHSDDLAVQRWAVLAPEGPEGDVMLAGIARLIAARAEQQGRPVRVYRVPPRMTLAEASRWKREVFVPSEPQRRDLARYQLLLGDLHQVPEALQVAQATDAFVGRLAFDRPADLEAYCDKLLRAERELAPGPHRAVFHTVQDGTLATVTGHRGLMRPCIEKAHRLRDERPALFPAEVLETGGPTPTRAELLTAAQQPGVLMSLSHGEGAPRGGWRDEAEQRAQQGAISFGRREGALRGADLGEVPFMPGGVWLMFACFGAGTPTSSRYARWLAELAAQGAAVGRPEAVTASLPRPGAPPFIAAIPKAVLANPRGPLAFIGHVDLAWTYSFCELDGDRPLHQPWRFLDTLAAVLRGDRVGVAFRELFRYFEQVNTELTALDEDPTPRPLRRAHLWMLRQDLAGFTLLGDPAARLQSPPAPPACDTSLIAQASARLGLRVIPPGQTRTDEPLAQLERAIGQVLAGSHSVAEVARTIAMESVALAALVDRYRRGGRAAIGRGD